MNGDSRPEGRPSSGVGTPDHRTAGTVRRSTIPATGDAEQIATNVIEALGPAAASEVARQVLELAQLASPGREGQV